MTTAAAYACIAPNSNAVSTTTQRLLRLCHVARRAYSNVNVHSAGPARSRASCGRDLWCTVCGDAHCASALQSHRDGAAQCSRDLSSPIRVGRKVPSKLLMLWFGGGWRHFEFPGAAVPREIHDSREGTLQIVLRCAAEPSVERLFDSTGCSWSWQDEVVGCHRGVELSSTCTSLRRRVTIATELRINAP